MFSFEYSLCSEAKFLHPDWGDIVDSGTGLLYRPARLHRPAGRYDNPLPEVIYIPHSGNLNFASVIELFAGTVTRVQAIRGRNS
jgi:hypothetical protein